MRVLIADRNARLLESISRTFARQFEIHTASSCEACNDLLAQGEFDLVLISEKLADGPGLELLARIARSSPDTLRVFAARRSRLQLLKGKLGPFGLFRTLSYPINPQDLLSTLTLAHSGLAIGAPGPQEGRAAQAEREVAQPRREVPAVAPAAAEVRPLVERISLTSADASFAVDVPKAILAQRRVRRSRVAPVHRPVSGGRQAQTAAPQLPSTGRQAQSATPQPSPAVAQQAPPAPQPARAQQHATLQPTRSPAAVAQFVAPARSPSQGGAFQHAARSRSAVHGPVAGTQYPMRSKLVLAAASVVVFVVTTLTLNMNDASVHVTRAATPRPSVEAPPAPEPPAPLAPAFRPEPTVARRVEPPPAVDPPNRQVTASNAPIADPSTFGHEAYEVVYDN
jgi:DNA-binding NarL/FixJ family response regulator